LVLLFYPLVMIRHGSQLLEGQSFFHPTGRRIGFARQIIPNGYPRSGGAELLEPVLGAGPVDSLVLQDTVIGLRLYFQFYELFLEEAFFSIGDAFII
jgi:hypothetical protein